MLSRKQCLSFGVIGIMKGNPHRSHLFLERIRNWIRIAIEIYVEGVYQTAARSWDIKLRISRFDLSSPLYIFVPILRPSGRTHVQYVIDLLAWDTTGRK